MLTEITNTRQNRDEPRRRWFTSNDLDLFVWYDSEDAIIQFQLCYNKGENEQALTWQREAGLTHHFVDDGEGGIYRMKSTVLIDGDLSDTGNVRQAYIDAGRELDQDLYTFVLDRIPATAP